MRHEIRNILKEFKPEIVLSISSGTLTCLVDELALDFNDEDRQKIQCDATNNGPICATDGLLDCLKCYDDCVFTKFMQFLKFNSTTKELFIKISDTCRSRGLESVLPQHEEKEKPALIFKSDKEAAKAMMKAIIPKVTQEFSDGDLSKMLQHFETEMREEDLQKIKRISINDGKSKAMSTTLYCLLHNGRKTFKKFVKYLYENKYYLYELVEGKCIEYNLKALLPNKDDDQNAKKVCMESSKFMMERHSSEPLVATESHSPQETSSGLHYVPIEELNLDKGHVSQDPPIFSTNKDQTKVEIYDMSSEPKGICLIINNENFSESRRQTVKGFTDRVGSSVDEENLKQTFTWLGFKVEPHRNKKALEMWDIFKELSKRDHSKYNCLVICILSHGLRKNNNDEITGIDGKTFDILSLISLFDGKNCKSLCEKPKLFFLQCCRGIDEDKGAAADEEYYQHDGISNQVNNRSKIPEACDFFVGYSTPPGYKSWRTADEGSFYVSTLCKVFANMARDYDLMTMMTKINAEVADYSTDKDCYQIPNPSMTFRKQLFFNPK